MLGDGYSRFLLCCKAVARPDEAHVWPLLEAAFYEHGLPWALRSDNGAPFASRAVAGPSELAVNLIKPGVLPQRMPAGQRQEHGSTERLTPPLNKDQPTHPGRATAPQ